MSVTYSSVDVIDPMSVRIKGTTDATLPATIRIYIMGLLSSTLTSTDGYWQFDLQVSDGQQQYVQVIDDAVSREDYAYPGQMTLAWQGKAGAASYRIDEFVGSDWVAQFTVQDRGEGAFTYLTHWLNDATTYQFRVMPIGADGNDGTALEFEFDFVRHPDVPNVTYPVDAGGNLTVTAAT